MKSIACVALILAATACNGAAETPGARIAPEYDAKTGKLQLLKYDANHNGTVDTVSYMDGARVLRIEIDRDEDGRIDRWEYYGADQKVERVALSASGDGQPTRTEWYEGELIVRAEEDTDRDSRTDKWETYQDGRLASLAFDTMRRGTPDRRLVYAPDGSARVEVDAVGDGHFAPSDVSTPTTRR